MSESRGLYAFQGQKSDEIRTTVSWKIKRLSLGHYFVNDSSFDEMERTPARNKVSKSYMG